LAIVSSIALVVGLALVLLLSLQPWAATEIAPRVGLPPGPGVALGAAVPAAGGRQLAVAPAQPALGDGRRPVASVAVVDKGDSGQQFGLAPSRALVDSGPASGAPAAPDEPPPASLPAPAVPEPVTASVPPPAPPPEPAGVAPTHVSAALGGQPGGPSTAGSGEIGGGFEEPLEIHEDDEYAFAFSFYVQPTAYRAPGEENLILRFDGEPAEPPSFGLQLWDDGSGTQRGLWSSGEAMGGERFLAPLAEGTWHRAVVYFQASSDDDGLYLLLLDGEPIDARAWIGLLPQSGIAQLEVGLFREGERVVGSPGVLFGPAELGASLESVLP
jgi:hypothetical protein